MEHPCNGMEIAPEADLSGVDLNGAFLPQNARAFLYDASEAGVTESDINLAIRPLDEDSLPGFQVM